jgi:Fic family protein
MAIKRLFDHISDMEPLLPEDRDGHLAALGLTLIRKAERLRNSLHPVTRKAVVRLVRSMNSYYSNLIEGHRTTPQDIEAALAKDFSTNPTQQALQMEHLAHVEVQMEIESRLTSLPPAEICSEGFLCWIHERFYRRLPDLFRHIPPEADQAREIAGGQLRQSEVSVGRHLAPAGKALPQFLKRYSEYYGPLVKGDPQGMIAAAAAHHRLTWIHPFLDGNGRVARLLSHAWLCKTEVDAGGLWAIARGMARRQLDYQAALSNADEKRVNDFDGRGYLSQRYLIEFCEFFLQTAIDQTEFMHGLLDLDRMQARIMSYAERLESTGELMRGAGRVLCSIFLRGEIARGEVASLMGASPRTAQKLTRELLTRKLVVSDSPKGLLRLGFPAEAAGYYFPNLYPAGTD